MPVVAKLFHNRKLSLPEYMITEPGNVPDDELFTLSQRDLSKRLPLNTSSRATFSIYFRWLEIHRRRPSPRTEHWSNTLMHWVQSLEKRGFGVEEVLGSVHMWKDMEGPFEGTRGRMPPSESEVRKAFLGVNSGKKEEIMKKKAEGQGEKFGMEYVKDRRVEKIDRSRGLDERRSWLDDLEEGEYDSEERDQDWHRELKKKQRIKKHVDKTKFDGPPPPSYTCNRCGKTGHHLQVCPTNLDPSYDSPPGENYQCEICHKKGEHWKSLCPQNSDPFSIIQKRKARGIIPPENGSNSKHDDCEKGTKTQRERESDTQRRRSRLRCSSNSSARNTASSGKKLELLDSLQDLEGRKQRLFRQLSEEMDGMIREGNGQRSSDRKRGPEEAISTSSPTLTFKKTRKKARIEDGKFDGIAKPRIQDGSEQQEHDEACSISNDRRRQSTPSVPFGPRSIGESPGSMISDDGESDIMDLDEPPPPGKEYTPFVDKLMRQRPEMKEAVNMVRRRKTASATWEEMERRGRRHATIASKTLEEIDLRTEKSKSPVAGRAWGKMERRVEKSSRSRTPPDSRSEYGRLTPVEDDVPMVMQYDGACDDFHFERDDPNHKLTLAEAEDYTFLTNPSQVTHTNLKLQISTIQNPTNLQISSQEHIMATPTKNTEPDSSSTTPVSLPSRTVHFRTRAGTEMTTDKSYFPDTEKEKNIRDVAGAFQGFAAQQQRNIVEASRLTRDRTNERVVNLQALKDFSTNFKLQATVPTDMIPLMSNDTRKQKEIFKRGREKSGGSQGGEGEAEGIVNGNANGSEVPISLAAMRAGEEA
ncbi:uncharacterized protein RCO7_02859 [Rhynchosporium graminicola]|uniref:CCHC-type domain-containing protein n=1 Tax=Rhynchosporium graminicola TaxID=2792576 RepID=A0A1E1KSH0_9HELO|nr:uncharacterized protein RCO7_02859 [Rhynchosporium commune]